MKNKNLNILILEDNPDDAELMVRELKKEGFVFEWKRVETEKTFRKALAEKPDIILSDYKLPSFNGMAAIKLQQQTAPDIPLILISGAIGEERAVECVKAGATDYVLKDKLSRLGHVIKRAIKEAEEHIKRNQAEEALKKSEQQLRSIVENMPIMMDAFDNEGGIIVWNNECERVTGYSSKEIINNPKVVELLYPDKDYRTFILESIAKHGNDFRNLEWEISCKDGSKKTILWSNMSKKYPIKSWHSWAAGIDITERKEAEKKLQKYAEDQKVLLKEVNHRVKNNLAAILGLLYMKEAKTKNKDFLTFINELIIRINGLSTVHSMLSESNWRPLNLNKLCDNIIKASLVGLPHSNMTDIYVSPSSIQINSNQAHNLTLVMNESITNSMKYGQNTNNKIHLNVDIKKNEKNIIITYRDNGPGYPQRLIDGDFSNIGVGFELIKGIVTQSLKGDVQIFNDNGAVTIIKFKLET